MTIILEYEKENPCDHGPDKIYRVIEVEGLTRKERKRKPRKVLEILREVKSTLFDNGDLEIEDNKEIKIF